MTLSPSIFKAYDVRGAYPTEFDADGASRIASALLAMFAQEGCENPTIVCGRDARPSSPSIADAVREALIRGGARVIDIGLVTTPLYYFAINHLRADGGIMVTASHNPLPANGLKLCRAEAVAIGEGFGMEELREFALSGKQFVRSGGSYEVSDILEPYLSFLLREASIVRPISAVVDPGNGMAGIVLEKLLPRLPMLTVRRLHFEVDGTFPNHEANPLKEETLNDLRDELRRAPADLGIAFDGDADRVGFLEANGASVNASLILALLAQRALETSSSGATILYAANVSRIVPETVRERGGEPIMTKVGHAHISRAMREHRALLGGELSGHFFFREFFCRDDAIVAMLRIVSMLSAAPSFESLLEPLRRYVQSGEMNFSVRNKEEAMRRVSEVFSDGTHSHLDGLTVEYPDWWFNLRPSHTEDLLRLNVEAKNEALLAEKLEMLKALLT